MPTTLNEYLNKAGPTIVNLCERWIDEHEYEDINEYGKIVQKGMPKGFRLENMTKKPFGFRFTDGQQRYRLECKVSKTQIALNIYPLTQGEH